MVKKDSIGQEVNIGDLVSYSRYETTRQRIGKIVKFTPCGVRIHERKRDGTYEMRHTTITFNYVKILKQD